MVQQRRLFRETVAYCNATRKVVTIPDDAAVSVLNHEVDCGLCTVFWEGRILLATCDDIEENSALIPEPETLRLLPQPELSVVTKTHH